jgi:hypothetical protein
MSQPTASSSYINDYEWAMVTSKTATRSVSTPIPPLSGPQGVSLAYPIGVPVCRVDVITYSVDTATKTLRGGREPDAGAQVVMDGITNMKIVTDATGTKPRYKVTLTGVSSQNDPFTSAAVQRSMMSTASARN